MLFQAVMKFLSRLVEINILVNWGMVHFDVSSEGPSCSNSRQRAFARNVEIPFIYFSGNCIHTKESLFILLALPTLVQTVQDHNIPSVVNEG